jgi:hypothetical protein
MENMESRRSLHVEKSIFSSGRNAGCSNQETLHTAKRVEETVREIRAIARSI